MASDTTPAWAFLSALGAGGAAAWVTKWFDRRKTSADVAQTVQSTYSELIDDLRQALTEARVQISKVAEVTEAECERHCDERIATVKAECMGRVTELEAELSRLRAQGESSG